MKTRRQEEYQPPQPRSQKKAYWREPESLSYEGPVSLAFSVPNPTPRVEEEKPPEAEIVPIRSLQPTVQVPEDNQVELDDKVALQAWLQAFASFPDDEGYLINRGVQHRVERKLQHRKNGAMHLKRTHVLKQWVTYLEPGDHFGDPTGRRHESAEGYPTREAYERRSGLATYHRGVAKETLRVVAGNDSYYKGPHWSPSMSTQQASPGFDKCLRPPTFAEVLQIHWNDVYEWGNRRDQELYLRVNGEYHILNWTGENGIVDAACWGPSLLDHVFVGPPTLSQLTQFSELQGTFEQANMPQEWTEDDDELLQKAWENPAFNFESFLPTATLEQRLQTGQEFAWVQVTDDGKTDYHRHPVTSYKQSVSEQYAPENMHGALFPALYEAMKTESVMRMLGVNADVLLLPPSKQWLREQRLDRANERFFKWLNKPTMKESLQRLDRITRMCNLSNAYYWKCWMEEGARIEGRRNLAYLQANQEFFKSIRGVVHRPFRLPPIKNESQRLLLWWDKLELSSHENRYQAWLLENQPHNHQFYDPFEKFLAHWKYQVACGRAPKVALDNAYSYISIIRKAQRLAYGKRVIPDYIHRDPPLGDYMNLGLDDKLDILNENLYKADVVDIESHLKDPVFKEYASLEKQRQLFDIEEEVLSVNPQELKLRKGQLTDREKDQLLSSFDLSLSSRIYVPIHNLSPGQFKKMLGSKEPDKPGVFGKIATAWKYLG